MKQLKYFIHDDFQTIVNDKTFPSFIKKQYAICTYNMIFDEIKASYYVVVKDNNRYLTNKDGDFLYDVQDVRDEEVLLNCQERSFSNWRLYSLSGPRVPIPKTINRGISWSQECIQQCAGNILIYLTKLHPKRTYGECEFIMKNEGYSINKQGFLEPIPGYKQL